MFNDLYYKLNTYAMEKDYNNQSIEEKKNIIEEGLKKYLEEKLSVKEEDNLSMMDLLSILDSKNINKEDINTITHYIIDVASNMQKVQIVWYGVYMNTLPEISFKEEIWDSITASETVPPVQTLMFVYDIFINRFMCSNKKLVKGEE